MVTTVPPLVGPTDGEAPETLMLVGLGELAVYVKPPACVVDWLRGFSIIVTLTVPPACAGVTARNWVEPTTITDTAGTPPKATEADCVNPVPEMVTEVPPVAGPLLGPTLLMESWLPEWPHPLPGNPAAKFVAMENARMEKMERR